MINADGSVSQATPNVTSTFNSTLARYEITFSGIAYSFLGYATIVTPADPGLTVLPATNSADGKLVIYFRSPSGVPMRTHFGFVTYDP